MQTDSERSVSLIIPLPITVLVYMSDNVSVYGDTFLRAPFLRKSCSPVTVSELGEPVCRAFFLISSEQSPNKLHILLVKENVLVDIRHANFFLRPI